MRNLSIAFGDSCQAKTWSNKKASFDDIKSRLRVTIRTSESVEEYARFDKAKKEKAKDHGGFVGGVLKNGRRKIDAVVSRSMIALDGDRVPGDFADTFDPPFACAMYSTHSHTPERPRMRIVFPLTRDVTPEEFVAVSRLVADMIGIDYFDECSYRPNQLMYWPSTPSNGEFVFREYDRDWLNPDDILSANPGWKDPTQLPTSSRESTAKAATGKKVQDPLSKDGIVGMFNNVYFPIEAALAKYLGHVYEPTGTEGRYHFIESGSLPGVEIIDDKFVYSHHAKDPAYMKLCNAFDIVRIHMFGDMDENASFSAMCDLAAQDDDVKKMMIRKKQAEAVQDFGEDDWTKHLQYSKNGDLRNTLHNITLIMENDEALKGIVFNQLADGMEIKGPVPWKHPARFWRDADDAQLISYIDSHYGTFSERNYRIAVTKVTDDRLYHPIREMFESLPPWDGVPRVDTLLIDYLGAEDNDYVRAVTRKALCAAYMRVYRPGIKFDYMVVLNGAQGIGKSTLIASLGMDWFSDSLAVSDMNDKTAAEKLQGYWILEIGELAGMKKADIDKTKAFISRQDDKYRASFGRRVTPHPRQCVFFGTTNSEHGYLRDVTGNRRFWNVAVTGKGVWKPWDITPEDVQQIWAEAAMLARDGEPLFLDARLEEYAEKEQSEAMEQDEREGLVREYLDTPLPDGWKDMDIYQRRDYLRDVNDPIRPKGVHERTRVSNMEIWCECLGKPKEDMKPADSYAISALMVRMRDWHKTGKRMELPIYGRQRYYKKG